MSNKDRGLWFDLKVQTISRRLLSVQLRPSCSASQRLQVCVCVFRLGEEPGCVCLTRRPTASLTWRTLRNSKSFFRTNMRRKNGEKLATSFNAWCSRRQMEPVINLQNWLNIWKGKLENKCLFNWDYDCFIFENQKQHKTLQFIRML